MWCGYLVLNLQLGQTLTGCELVRTYPHVSGRTHASTHTRTHARTYTRMSLSHNNTHSHCMQVRTPEHLSSIHTLLTTLETRSHTFCSTALLGAMGGGDGVLSDEEAKAAGVKVAANSTCTCGRGGGDDLPMQSWSMWWLVRTYLQSLGQVCVCSCALAPSAYT